MTKVPIHNRLNVDPKKSKGDDEKTLVDIWIFKLKKHPFVAGIIFLCIAVIGIGKFTDALSEIKRFISVNPSSTQPNLDSIKQDSTKTFVRPKDYFLINGFVITYTEQRMIEDSTGMTYSNNAVGKIVSITFNKQSVRSYNYANQELYRFNGSDIQININGVECVRYKNALAPSVLDKKERADAQQDGYSKFEYFINDHRSQIILKIISCLRQ